jgi:hypothetical protein
MNLEMAGATVQQHTNEIRRQAARCRGGSASHRAAASRTLRSYRNPPAQIPSRQSRPSALRSRVGITLVAAGLHLLAADASQPTRS